MKSWVYDFLGIELDENYFNIAKERIENTPYNLDLLLDVECETDKEVNNEN